ncbi:MAG: hypothetical protein VB122_02475 [Erysipelotrichales bacterium]|nr:hypothetical protein [Erysipelotrichales bacterium]
MDNKYIFDCDSCPTKCDGTSKGVYIFMNDVDYSEHKENQMISQINTVSDFYATKCELDGYPDIEVLHKPTGKTFFVEIKAQRRTFMSVKRILPNGGLEPSETLALNLSDLLRYFEIRRKINKPIFILWCLQNRPCIVPVEKTYYYYQDTMQLEEIYNNVGDKRRFRRESGKGDVVNGQHKGVVVNYHFSLNELDELHIFELLERGIQK